MWKVGGLKIVTAASRRIILPGWNRNWWKSAFFYKTLRTRKFSMGKFFEGSTHGILTHSRFRICVLKGSVLFLPKVGRGRQTQFASKINLKIGPPLPPDSTTSKTASYTQSTKKVIRRSNKVKVVGRTKVGRGGHLCTRWLSNNPWAIDWKGDEEGSSLPRLVVLNCLKNISYNFVQSFTHLWQQ